MMKPERRLRWACSSSSFGAWFRLFGRRRPLGLGKKKSKGSMPKFRRCMSLVLTTSVEVMDTTAGATRAAMSAKDGMVTDVTVALGDVVWMDVACAFDFRISPRSALTTIPNATDAMTIAIVDKKCLVREFIGFAAPYAEIGRASCRERVEMWVRDW